MRHQPRCFLGNHSEKKLHFRVESAYYLIDNGYDAVEYDLANMDYDYTEFSNLISLLDAPIIGVTGYTRERFHAYRLIKAIRKACPSALIIVGGHHFGFLANETLDNLPEVDIVVRGEGEITFKEICDAVYEKGGLDGINGITYQDRSNINIMTNKPMIIENNDAKLERNLGAFRTWDESDFKEVWKKQVNKSKLDPMRKYFTVMATRGCPSNCNFCSLSTDIVRFRPISHVLDEIEGKIRITGLRNVSFKDSSLTINKSFVRALCDGILERNLNIRWNCYSRADMSHELIAYMRKAGCISVEVALESGSPRILKSIGKGINLEKYLSFVEKAHSLGIKVWVFLIVSLTDETYEDALKTLELLKKSAPFVYDFGLQVTRILPDTQLDQIARDRGVLPENFDWFSPYKNENESLFKTDAYGTLPIYIEKMSVEEIQDILEKFEHIKETEFVYPDGFLDIIMMNLKLNMLRKLTLPKLLHKMGKFMVMLAHLGSTRKKIHSINHSKVDIDAIPRPEWVEHRKRVW
jgi:anaerobic magnesium-protoporphyrin IX monomethyl ester cyclase